MAANAQQRLEGASDPSNDRSLKDEARQIIDELFDDEGDREVFEDLANRFVDKAIDSPFADALVGMTLDGVEQAYKRTAPQDK